ncbi:MAG: hypothetical protein ACRDTD_29990, partial [Pseudonocardiaceae bacterium]
MTSSDGSNAAMGHGIPAQKPGELRSIEHYGAMLECPSLRRVDPNLAVEVNWALTQWVDNVGIYTGSQRPKLEAADMGRA